MEKWLALHKQEMVKVTTTETVEEEIIQGKISFSNLYKELKINSILEFFWNVIIRYVSSNFHVWLIFQVCWSTQLPNLRTLCSNSQ